MFEIKTGYCLELLTPETMKLLRSTESKITKDKNGEIVLHLETTEVLLVYNNIVNKDINKFQKSCIHLFLINLFVI